ncbi:hypothetical protein GCM10020219_008030 [Nonomuraea dietziae]
MALAIINRQRGIAGLAAASAACPQIGWVTPSSRACCRVPPRWAAAGRRATPPDPDSVSAASASAWLRAANVLGILPRPANVKKRPFSHPSTEEARLPYKPTGEAAFFVPDAARPCAEPPVPVR